MEYKEKQKLLELEHSELESSEWEKKRFKTCIKFECNNPTRFLWEHFFLYERRKNLQVLESAFANFLDY